MKLLSMIKPVEINKKKNNSLGQGFSTILFLGLDFAWGPGFVAGNTTVTTFGI